MTDGSKARKGLLERLQEGPILGDGGMTIGLERRGYSKVGVFTPESTVLHPDAGETELRPSVSIRKCASYLCIIRVLFKSESKSSNLKKN